MIARLVALAAAAVLACAPAAAQLDVRTLPLASTLTGSERSPAVQGSGCPSKTTPCANVVTTPDLVRAYVAQTLQAKSATLDAIAPLATTGFGRSLLTQADAAAVRSAIGVTATGQDTTYLWRANNLSGLTDVAAARANLGGVAFAACRTTVAASVTGTTAETTQATCALPGGAIGPNGFVEALPTFTLSGSSAKTIRVRLAGVEIWSATPSTQLGVRAVLMFNNVNSASTQFAMNPPNPGVGNATAAGQIYRTSVNTANPTSLTVTCQPTSASDSCTLESLLVRITFGA